MNEAQPLRIVIVGGGTAGWMAANLFAKRWGDGRASVTLVESPDIGIIGVGEGSTPQLKAFFASIGADEAEWMPRCNATYKVGILFRGWAPECGAPSYFHPFPTQIDGHTAPAFFHNGLLRRQGLNVVAHPDRFFLPARLAQERLAPMNPVNFPFEASYGYHFDAHLVGQYLCDHAGKFGVRHVRGSVANVAINESGAISHLDLEGGQRIEGDFFVDSTGFRSLLAQQALGVKFNSFKANLFNDSAVTIPTPDGPEGPDCQTIATTLGSGWAWRIPLTNRVGNGYVYSSAYCLPEDAEAELRRHLGRIADDAPARHLRMNVGQVEKHWTANCLAVGLSQGFIEPLEATALHLVQSTVENFIASYEQNGFTNAGMDDFNRRVAARFEGVRDYIVCHYKMNMRTDTPYWRDNAANENLSDSLRGVLSAWFGARDLREEIARQQISTYYTAISWQCLLAGYGRFPDRARLRPPSPAEERFDMSVIDTFIERCAMNFKPHRTSLQQVREPVAVEIA